MVVAKKSKECKSNKDIFYDEDFTRSISNDNKLLKKYEPYILFSLDKLLNKEGCRNISFGTEVVWNLDLFETEYKKSVGVNEKPTVDFCMGLSSKKILLVEVKAKVTSRKNIKPNEIDNKVKYSREILEYKNIISRTVVIVKNEELIRSTFRLLYYDQTKYQVITANKFKENYFK